MLTSHSINSCPNCQSNNKVEKVTSILKSQTSQTQGQMPVESVHTDSEGRVYSSTDYRSYSSSQSSSLAQELTPPQKPTGNSYGCCIAYFIMQMIGMGLAGLVMIPYSLIFLVNYLFSELDTPSEAILTRPLVAGGVLILIVGYIGLGFLFFLGYNYFQKKKAEEQKRVEETEVIAWQYAMRRWNQLYYCYRCDCLFIQGEEPVPASEMHAYIYRR